MAIVVNDILKFREYVGDTWKNLLIQANIDFNLIYPVGSIYMSTNSTNPALLFGGTWEQLEDTFLLGAGSTYTAGDTGGSATHVHATKGHVLTVTEMPSHTHGAQGWRYGHNQKYDNHCMSYTKIGSDSASSSTPILSTGGNGSHDHGDTESGSSMPPYIVVYMWKRLTLAPSLPYPTNIMTDIGEVETPFSIPASGSSVSYDMAGMTDEYELVKWNFSSSPENQPPVDLSCVTYNGYFTITNNGGTTSETICPMFIKAKKVAVTVH